LIGFNCVWICLFIDGFIVYRVLILIAYVIDMTVRGCRDHATCMLVRLLFPLVALVQG